MKGTQARLCTLFPWLFTTPGMKKSKDCPGLMATEFRGLGKLAFFERADLSYTSLRDIMAAQTRRPPSMTMEMEDLGLWFNHAHPRTPKSRLLEKAAHAWLQPSIADRSRKQNTFLSRYWRKLTNRPYSPTPPTPRRYFSTTFASCVVYCPFLKWFDLSPILNRLRRPQPQLALGTQMSRSLTRTA